MLTIDYGDQLTAQSRLPIRGTLRSYWKHQRFTGREIYARFGKQDITADVNFSDLIRWGEELSYKNSWVMKQSMFISSIGSGATSSQKNLENFMTEASQHFLVLEQKC
jgi:SAM-dependent MidA family methyltransferase